jgi:prepilin-type N-terminal cleavage/methylation domain-containing protein
MFKTIRNHSGFTLIEVMIAITLLSFIMIAVVSITSSSQTTKDRVLSEDKELLQIETAFSRFEWDFSQIYSPLYFSHEMKKENLDNEDSIIAMERLFELFRSNKSFPKPSYDGLPIPEFTFEDKDTFAFFTTSNRRKLKNIKQSHFAWVQYSLETDREISLEDGKDSPKVRAKGILTRRFQANDVFNPEGVKWDDLKKQVLLRNVESLKFEFWSPDKKKWVDNIELVTNGKYIIRGVKITLEWMTPEETKLKFVRVYRSLFPKFIPENMYELAKQTAAEIAKNEKEEEEKDEGEKD